MFYVFVGLVLGAPTLADTPEVDQENGDISYSLVIKGTPETIYERTANLQTIERIFPPECVTNWAHGAATVGPNARSRLTYTVGGMVRRLTVVLDRFDPPNSFDMDHPSEKKGFVTRWQFLPVNSEETEVTITTYLSPPPWPFTRHFHRQVKPKWEACYERTLYRLQRVINP